jgi:signal transduction histidine kinase
LAPANSHVDASTHAAAERTFAAARNGAVHRAGAFLPLRAGEDVFGLIVLMGTQFPRPGSAEDVVLEAMAVQLGIAIRRMTLEEKARHAERGRQRAEQAKAEAITTLAGGLAHDLNNLLTGVLGNASLVEDSLPADHPARKQLRELAKSGERAADIVAQVLSYAGKGRFFNQVIDVSALVRDFAKHLPAVPAHIELNLKLEDHLPLLEGDRNQLLQLIGNLYLNAVEAIGEVAGRIVISTYRQQFGGDGSVGGSRSTGECVCLSVTDTGCGIEEAIIPRVFDPFFTTKFVGRGLGLSAAQGIMHSHNGAIRVLSELGKGTTFSCSFALPPGQ